MKIAFLITNFPKLSETFILNQIVGLSARGHEVDIYASCSGNDPTRHEDIEKYSLLSRTHYYGEGSPSNKLLRLFKAIILLVTQLYKSPRTIVKSLNFFRFGREAASLSLFYKTMFFLNMRLNVHQLRPYTLPVFLNPPKTICPKDELPLWF